MVQSFTEGRYMEEFLFSEGNGNISREKATVSSGQNLVAGTVVQLVGGELVAFTGTENTEGALDVEAAGILSADVDATDGDVEDCVYIARDAEVVESLLTFPVGSGPRAHAIASLKALHIITR